MKSKRVLKLLLVFLIVTIGVYALYFNKKLANELDKIEQSIDEIIDKVETNKPIENKPSDEENKKPVEEQPLTQA